MEGAICYRPEAGFAWCSVLWYPAVAKGVGTRAEATDAMDGNGGNDTKTAIEVHFTPSYMFSLFIIAGCRNGSIAMCSLRVLAYGN